MSWKNIVWEIIGQFARVLPPSLLELLLNSEGKVNRFARLGLIKRDVTVRHGVASGLKFNAGAYNPDTAIGTYEMPVQEILSQYLKPGDIFYDLGANVGFFTILAAKILSPAGKVYAFEPEAENAATLRRNVELNNFAHITVIEKAVSKTTGVEKLWLKEYCGSHTLASPITKFDPKQCITVNTVSTDDLLQKKAVELPAFLKIKECITVNTVSIDDLLEQKAIEPPTFVKIDVEGAEIDVLYGMSQTIQKWQPIIIYEVDDEKKEGLLNKQKEINDFLLPYGYEIKSLAQSYSGISWNVGHAIAIPA